MMVKSARPGEGVGWVHALPLSLYLPSRAKLWCMLQLTGHRDTPPIYTSISTLRCLPASSSNLKTAEEVLDGF
jgi:hypothetical protein